MSPAIESLVELAIVARIRAAAAAQDFAYRIASIESYRGEFDGEIGEVVRAMPGVWVTFGGSGKGERISADRTAWKVPLTFVTIVGVRNVRSEGATRHGTAAGGRLVEVGAYQMLADVRALLLGQDLGLEINPLEPGAVRALVNTRIADGALAVYAQEWHTAMVVREATSAEEAASPKWLRIGLNYHLAPDDGLADSADLVSLNP